MPPEPQGLEVAPPSPFHVTFFVDKGLATQLPPNTKEEQVQVEKEEEPQQAFFDEVLEEGQISEKPHKTFQAIEVRTVDSTDTEAPNMDPS